jgi:uncharacterized membrane protein YgcG
VPQSAIDLLERTRIFYKYGTEAAEEFSEELQKEESALRYRKATSKALKKRKSQKDKGSKAKGGSEKGRKGRGGGGSSYIPNALFRTLTDEQKAVLLESRRK